MERTHPERHIVLGVRRADFPAASDQAVAQPQLDVESCAKGAGGEEVQRHEQLIRYRISTALPILQGR